jgi:hypothetical protein
MSYVIESHVQLVLSNYGNFQLYVLLVIENQLPMIIVWKFFFSSVKCLFVVVF